MKTIKAVVCCIVLLNITSYSHADGKSIMKWVDKNGVTHYGDKPPMPSDANQSSVLNKDGVTVKKIQQSASNPETDRIAAEQARRDAALFSSYNSIEEIDIARDRNIKIDAYTLESFYQKRNNIEAHLQKNNALIANLTKLKRPVPKQLTDENIEYLRQIDETNAQIGSKKIDIETTRARFERDKIRYAELKPKASAIKDIKSKKVSVIELELWRTGAQSRVDYYKNEVVRYKRSGLSIPQHVSDGLLAATQEVARADGEIETTKALIKKKEQSMSDE
ncbi:MAG: DUF4124 domain-containing protein [Methylophilus sp.]|nr:DUF4124 domain-containing protein [Methylophilus sp.]